jgi:hypothetical protein
MPTAARTRARPSPGAAPVRKRVPPDSAHTRLPWWAAVLPVLTFVLLLGVLGGGEADAAQHQPGIDVLAEILQRVEQALRG